MPLYEFYCSAGHVTERRTRDYELSSVGCSVCGAPASRAEVNRIGVSGLASLRLKDALSKSDYAYASRGEPANYGEYLEETSRQIRG